MEWLLVVCLIVVQLLSGVAIHFTAPGDSSKIVSVLVNPQKYNTSQSESHNKILQALEACNWGETASVSIEDVSFVEFSKYTLELSPSPKFSVTHYVISHSRGTDEHLRSIIWNSYSQQFLTDFIVATSCPECVVQIATDIFQKEKRGPGALMTNRLRFVIVTWIPIQNLQPLFKTVIFDNVAVIVVNENTIEVEGVYTLMWRNKSSREFEPVSYMDRYFKLGRTPVCNIFPNMNYGLNGRSLVGLSKEWVTYLYKTSNPEGRMTYAGFSASVIEILAQDLNFSYTLVPQPGMDDALTWRDYELLIQSQEADFGADLYISNMMAYLNTTVSFPVISGDIRGIYKRPRKTEVSQFDVLRKSGLPVGVILSLISTVGFYLLTEKCLAMMSVGGLCDTSIPCHSVIKVQKDCHTNLTDIRNSQRIYSRNIMSQKNHSQGMFANVEEVELQEIAIVDTVETNQRRHQTVKWPRPESNGETDASSSSAFHHKRETKRAGIENRNRIHDRISTYSRHNSNRMLIHQQKRDTSPSRVKSMLKSLRVKDTLGKSAQRKVPISSKKREENSPVIQKLSPLNRQSNSIVVLDMSTDNTNMSGQCDARVGINLSLRFRKELIDASSQTSHSDPPASDEEPKLNIMETFFAFLGSICGQGTLPTPPLFSARLLLCSWCLTLITTTAIFNGGLTADFLDNTDSVPFRTFSDLLSRTDYKWGFYNESTIFKIMEFSKPGTLFNQIHTGVTKFLKTDPYVLGTFEDIHRKLTTEKFVAILDTFSQKYLENVMNLTDLIVLSDVLLTTNLGYVFPKNSELESVFSKQIMKLVEHGVIEDIFRKSFPHYKRDRRRTAENNGDSINLSTLIDLIRICGGGAALSLVILILECIVGQTNVIAIFRKLFRQSLAAFKHL